MNFRLAQLGSVVATVPVCVVVLSVRSAKLLVLTRG